MEEDKEVSHLGSADELVPCCANCCFICSLYTDWPECLGCRMKGQFCCASAEQIYCMPACSCCGDVNPRLKKNPLACCVLCDGLCVLITPDTCCALTEQCCCIDQRCAIPCTGKDGDVPCVITVLGLTCCVAFSCKPACCSTLGLLKADDAGAPALAIEDADADVIPEAEIVVPTEKIDRD